MSRGTGSLEFGIAGWSYDDWRDVVYPRGCKDTLRYCAEYVDCIEINSTFYRFPVARYCESWARRVEDIGTHFTAKLPRDFTHQSVRDDAAAAEVRAGFDPLREAGRLTALLAQFSYRFDRSDENLEHLRWMRDAFSPVAPLTIEVRHRSWASPAALDELRALGVGVANLDYPGTASGFGVRSTEIHARPGIAYFRLHGRNADAWFDKKAGRDEVYDYAYSSDEVTEIADRAAEIGAVASRTIVVANNHFQGKAMKLVLELLARYRDAPVPVPDPLLRTYPELREIAARPPGKLF